MVYVSFLFRPLYVTSLCEKRPATVSEIARNEIILITLEKAAGTMRNRNSFLRSRKSLFFSCRLRFVHSIRRKSVESVVKVDFTRHLAEANFWGIRDCGALSDDSTKILDDSYDASRKGIAKYRGETGQQILFVLKLQWYSSRVYEEINHCIILNKIALQKRLPCLSNLCTKRSWKGCEISRIC